MAKKQKRQVSRSVVTNEPAAVAVSAKVEKPVITSFRSQATEFNPDYSYVKKDLKQIATLAVAFVSILVVLSFFVK